MSAAIGLMALAACGAGFVRAVGRVQPAWAAGA